MKGSKVLQICFEVFLNNENSEATDQNTNSSENFPMIALWIGRQALNVKTQDLNSSTPALPRAKLRDQFQFFWFKISKRSIPKQKGQSTVQYLISTWLLTRRRKSLAIIYHCNRFHQPWRSKSLRYVLLIPHPLIFEKAHLVKSQLESCYRKRYYLVPCS